MGDMTQPGQACWGRTLRQARPVDSLLKQGYSSERPAAIRGCIQVTRPAGRNYLEPISPQRLLERGVGRYTIHVQPPEQLSAFGIPDFVEGCLVNCCSVCCYCLRHGWNSWLADSSSIYGA